MRLLITRPQEDAAALAKRLSERGIEALIEPMFDIVHQPAGAPGLHGAQAILLTSANGARALAALSTVRWVPVLAVGDATARTAKELGFIKVESAAGDVETLAAVAEEMGLDPDVALAYLHGDEDREQIAAEDELGRRMQITGVPTFIFNRQVVAAGAREPEVLLEAFEVAAQHPVAADA